MKENKCYSHNKFLDLAEVVSIQVNNTEHQEIIYLAVLQSENYIKDLLGKSFDAGYEQGVADELECIKTSPEHKPFRENDVSAWQNYGNKMGYFKFFEGREEAISEYLKTDAGKVYQDYGKLKEMAREEVKQEIEEKYY